MVATCGSNRRGGALRLGRASDRRVGTGTEVLWPGDLSHWTLPWFMLCASLILMGLCVMLTGGETSMVADDDVRAAEHDFLGQVRKLTAEHCSQADVGVRRQTDLRPT